MAPFTIRKYGDPVLRQRAAEVTEIDGKLAKLASDMLVTMYDEPGAGLAAPQVGVQKRLFVYDVGEGPRTIVNPRIVESDGEWAYDEGCLSIPGLSFELVRPNHVHLVGYDLDGILYIERLDEDQRKAALKAIRQMSFTPDDAPAPGLPGLSLR